MQNSLSQILSELLESLPCADNETYEGDEVDSQLFRKVWERVPVRWKRNCAIPRETKPKPSSDRLRVDSWKSDSINISQIVLTHLRMWEKDPSSFLISDLQFSNDRSHNAFTRLYKFMDHSKGEATVIQNIRLRFVQMGMFDLRTRLELSRIRQGSDADDEFASRVQVEGDRSEISKNIRKWATAGGKYFSLAHSLGGFGAMICIPTDVSTAKIERIPRDGDLRDQAIACFKRRGIHDLTNTNTALCYEVATRIWSKLRADTDSNFLAHSLQIPKRPEKRASKELASGPRKRRQTSRGSNIDDVTFHQSLNTSDMTGLNMDCSVISKAQSPVPAVHNSNTPVSSDCGLATLAVQQRDIVLGQEYGVERSPHPNCTGITVSQAPGEVNSDTSTTLPAEEGDFWEYMAPVVSPSTFWENMIYNALPQTSDFWGEMDEIPLEENGLTC